MIDIIIRTKNEYSNLKKLLPILKSQTYENHIILVDSESTDNTNKLIDKYKLEVTQCIPFTYGKALNQGIDKATSEFVAILSPHCFPTKNNYLENLFKNLDSSTKTAGVYSRQIPHKYTNPIEYRNFVHTYGSEKIIQDKCPLFNNGASMINKNIWETIPFDETLPALEDIHWAKRCQDKGYHIIYEPDSIVEHLHDESYADTIKRYEKECIALKQMGFLKW